MPIQFCCAKPEGCSASLRHRPETSTRADIAIQIHAPQRATAIALLVDRPVFVHGHEEHAIPRGAHARRIPRTRRHREDGGLVVRGEFDRLENVRLGARGCVLGEGGCGEMVIAGPNVSPGYFRRDDLTAAAFSLRAYRTDDSARESARLFFCDSRMTAQIKLFGYRIELGDLEANLRALPEIVDAVVLPVRKAGKIESLAAFVILSSKNSGIDFQVSAALKAKLSERLPAYMVWRNHRARERRDV